MWFGVLSAVLYGILEGVTEWLPISSTGHLILLDRVLPLSVSDAFFELLEVVIQLGAILAVVVLFRKQLSPFCRDATRRRVLSLWALVLLAALPAAAVGLLLDGWLSTHLYTPATVAVTLILYGGALIAVEKWRKRDPYRGQIKPLDAKRAFGVGGFQVLALVPGTSRSGATILGGLLLGLDRQTAAEFSFFLGIPTMLGAGALKCFKFFAAGLRPTAEETVILLVGTATAFLCSLAVIRFLMDFVRRHSFAPFGVYRILLGGAVLAAHLLGAI